MNKLKGDGWRALPAVVKVVFWIFATLMLAYAVSVVVERSCPFGNR